MLTTDSSNTDPTTNLTRITPGLKNRGLRSRSMNLRSAPLDDVTLTRPSATLSRWERGWWWAVFAASLSVRQSALSSIVLQLQPRYRKCVHFGGGAYIEVEKVRTTSLRTKGAYISCSDVRTCNLETIANRLQLPPAERHGGRSLQKAVSARTLQRRPWRAADASPPLRSRPHNVIPHNLPLRSVILDCSLRNVNNCSAPLSLAPLSPPYLGSCS
jgi:hypothetical protein